MGTVKYFNSLEAWRIAGEGRRKQPIEDDSDDGFDDIFNDSPSPSKPKAESDFNWSDDDLPF